MEWNAKDAESFFNSREYVDTCIIPMVPLSFNQDGKEAGNQSEFVQLISKQLENQFKGRVLLLPPFVYFKSSILENKKQQLNEWSEQIQLSNFKHQVYVSTDLDMKNIVEDSGNTFIWLPALPLLQMDQSTKMKIVQSQAEQLYNIFINQWTKE